MAFKADYDFWTHGVNVQIEYTDQSRDLYVRRAGWGTLIKQKKGTGNWFHFAIPSATKLDDDKVKYHRAWLRADINNHATIKQIHIREARSGTECPTIYEDNSLNLTGREINESFDIDPNRKCKGPLVICIFVDFSESDGQVIFRGAGARFEEK